MTFLEDDFDLNLDLHLHGSIKSANLPIDNAQCPVLTKIATQSAPQIDSSVPSQTSSPPDDHSESSSLDSLEHSVNDANSTIAHPMVTQARNGISKPNLQYLLQVSAAPTVPTRIKAALASPTWKVAMAHKIAALEKNESWSLQQLNLSMNVLASKWVFKHKMNNEGKIIRHKARLVAVGSNQQNGVDYTKTFTPVVKPATIRLILSIAVTNN